MILTGKKKSLDLPIVKYYQKVTPLEDGTVIGLEDIAAISGFQFEI